MSEENASDVPKALTGSDLPITQWVLQWQAGDQAAAKKLLDALYPVLKSIAQQRLAAFASPGTLRATELVSEAYLRMLQVDFRSITDRRHFLALSATLIRNIVVDHARARGASKRGGDFKVLAWQELSPEDDEMLAELDLRFDWLGIDQALTVLAESAPESARIVELKFFADLQIAEIAEVMGLSSATVSRQWRFARAWLQDRLDRSKDLVDYRG